MVTAIVLLKVERLHINRVAEELAALEGISEVYSVGGEIDVVAMIRVRTNEELAELVTNHLLRVEGIVQSQTLLAFRAYSRHALEAMFALGAD